MIDQEEYNVGRIVTSVTILYSLTKNNILFPWREKNAYY